MVNASSLSIAHIVGPHLGWSVDEDPDEDAVVADVLK